MLKILLTLAHKCHFGYHTVEYRCVKSSRNTNAVICCVECEASHRYRMCVEFWLCWMDIGHACTVKLTKHLKNTKWKVSHCIVLQYAVTAWLLESATSCTVALQLVWKLYFHEEKCVWFTETNKELYLEVNIVNELTPWSRFDLKMLVVPQAFKRYVL